MNRISEAQVQCELCEEFIAVEDARIICNDCFTYAQNIPTWHPIENAPKDRTRILVPWKGEHFIVAWGTGKTQDYRVTDGWKKDSGYIINPTHWMPLPELPKEGKG